MTGSSRDYLSRRTLILSFIFVPLLRPFFQFLYPLGLAKYVKQQDRPVVAPIDYSNESLMLKNGKLKKIYERIPENQEPLLKGHETILFDNSGAMFALAEGSKLISITNIVEDSDDSTILKADVNEVAYLGVGRPLGAQFAKDGSLIVADVILGLLKVSFPKNREPVVEVLATRVKLSDGTWSRIIFADDVAIGPKTGIIYFSDATDIAPDRLVNGDWDVMYASRLNGMLGSRTGRLLSYDPKTQQVEILADGFSFANGIGIDKDETYVAMSESLGMHFWKYNLTGPKKGKLEVLANGFLGMTGIPDGASCSHKTGKCYASFASGKPSIFNFLELLSPFADQMVRNLLLPLPKFLAPDTKRYGGCIEVDPKKPGKITRLFQDPYGKDITDLHGVTVHNEKLYFGSLHNDFIGVFDLSE